MPGDLRDLSVTAPCRRRARSRAYIFYLWHNRIAAAGLALLVLLSVSCKSTHSIKAVKQQSPPVPSLKKMNIYTLSSKIRSRQFNYKWISAHFSINISVDSSSNSFGGTVRMRKDSVIWLSIAPLLGIEADRIMLTQDSAMEMNRLKDTYFKDDYDYINSRLHEDLDFELIQAIMIGSRMEFINDTSKMKSYFNGSEYIVSTIRRKRMRRVLYRNKPPVHNRNEVQFIFLDPSDFHITHVKVQDFVNHRSFDAYYSDFQKVDSVNFPFHIECVIAAERNIKIDLQYKKVIFKPDEEVPFFIPKKYERIQY
ncbi:MAG: DUF4292 domain-containing protein [Bacteroidia bacterium]|jgi:hypothetical protein|nr:DUF4292 domain-containing protein [Bacteroidia bacterium]